MISKHSLSKVLNFRVSQLGHSSQKFQKALSVYVAQITDSAQIWIEKSEDCDQQQFLEVSVPLEQTMMMLLEMTTEIEGNLTSQLLGSDSARPSLTPVTDPLPLTVVESQGLDQSLRSLLERLDTFQDVTDMVQDLRTDLDAYKRQVDSVQGTKLKQKFNQYKEKQSSKIQKLEKQMSKMEQALRKTDSQIKDLTGVVSALKEQFTCMRSLSGCEDELHVEEKNGSNGKRNRSARSCSFDDGLFPDESVPECADDRVRVMEEKLAELIIENQLMKAQVERETEEREKRSNDVRDVQDKLSALELEILNLKDNRSGCLDGSMQSGEEDGSEQSAEEDGSVQSAEEDGSVQSGEEDGSVQLVVEDGKQALPKANIDDNVQPVEEDRTQALVKTDSMVSNVPSKISAAERNGIASEINWTGFCTLCLCEIRTVTRSHPIPWDLLCMGISGGFDNKTGVFTAPIDGLYFVIFVHCQIGRKPTIIRLVLSDQVHCQEKTMITTITANRDEYSFGQRHIFMSAGDTFYLSLPKNGCHYQIPFFSCILVE